MQRWGVALVLILMSMLVTGGSVNYCGAKMCGNTNAHTFCQYSEIPSAECVGNIPAELSLEEKARVISRLNQRRNEAAAGRLRGLPSAGNMLRLRWVEELAREAQRWANQCRPPQQPEEHDACRDLYSIPVGQCVASVVGEAPGLRVESMVDMWNLQALLYKRNVTYYVPPEENGRRYDDFAQMMWSRTYMVGCGRSRFMTMKNGRLRSVERLVCNFAPRGPVPGRPLWAPAMPKTACPPRAVADEGFSALCNFHEDTHDNTFTEASMTLKEHLLLNTILEIENNVTLDYIGSLDEIYLTKLAIATLDRAITTENHANSIQRRDVVDISELEDLFNNNIDNKANSLAQETYVTVNVTTATAKTISSKKLGLVGRPKSYQIEELNDVETKVENKNAMIEEVSEIVKDVYNEYDFENEESTTFQELINSTSESRYLDRDNVDSNKTTLGKFNNTLDETANTTILQYYNTDNTSLSYKNSGETLMENVTQHYANTSADIGDKSLEDYLSDPETVRQLQDALDRMESSIAQQQSTEKSGKVRREIRNTEMESDSDDKTPAQSMKKELNKNIDKNPMMSMAFKYVPYLKQYEHEILGKNKANSMLSRSFFVFCLINIV